MSKELIISKSVTKYLNKLPKNTKDTIYKKIIILREHPEELKNNIIKMQGKDERYRFKSWLIQSDFYRRL